MEEAERIAREEHGSVKLAVISGACASAAVLAWFLDANSRRTALGVGTRDYYRRLGYELDGPYMSKSLL